MRFFIALFLLSVGLGAASPEGKHVVKIVVKFSGAIYVDEARSDLQTLSRQLDALKGHKDVVIWYYLATVDGQTHANAKAVMQLIAQSQIPFTKALKEDFSDVVRRINRIP